MSGQYLSTTAPQFSVQRRSKHIFETMPDIRTYSLGTAAEHVSKAEQKSINNSETLKICQDADKSGDHSIQEEDLDQMLGNLNFRLNEVKVPTRTERHLPSAKVGKGLGRCRSSGSLVVDLSATQKAQRKLQKNPTMLEAFHESKERYHTKEDQGKNTSVRAKALISRKLNRKTEVDLADEDQVPTPGAASTQLRPKLAAVQPPKSPQIK